MKTLTIFLIFVLILSFSMVAQESEPTGEASKTGEMNNRNLEDIDITLGSIRFPRAFIHAQKDYAPGIYYITLTAKAGTPYFNVYSQTQELLFEEMAVVKPNKGKSGKFNYRVKKGFLNKQEYFNLKVITPTHRIMAFFLVKK
ncbi:MAG: hypothetical protein PVH61_15990 [Candidatus Aminicenantes bacterium]|jgi:hypothetical protein